MNKIAHDKFILNFLHDWLDWATMKEPDNRHEKHVGLCSALNNKLYNITSLRDSDEIATVFTNMFIADGLDRFYPFGEKEYDYHCINSSQHTVKDRVEWVKSTITRLQKELYAV